MNKNNITSTYIAIRRVCLVPGSTDSLFLSNLHNTYSLRGIGIFILNRQLLRILPLLIISSIKQKLMIEPTEYNASACNELTVLSCDLHLLFEVVRG